jgi:hypothetical protein
VSSTSSSARCALAETESSASVSNSRLIGGTPSGNGERGSRTVRAREGRKEHESARADPLSERAHIVRRGLAPVPARAEHVGQPVEANASFGVNLQRVRRGIRSACGDDDDRRCRRTFHRRARERAGSRAGIRAPGDSEQARVHADCRCAHFPVLGQANIAVPALVVHDRGAGRSTSHPGAPRSFRYLASASTYRKDCPARSRPREDLLQPAGRRSGDRRVDARRGTPDRPCPSRARHRGSASGAHPRGASALRAATTRSRRSCPPRSAGSDPP